MVERLSHLPTPDKNNPVEYDTHVVEVQAGGFGGIKSGTEQGRSLLARHHLACAGGGLRLIGVERRGPDNHSDSSI